MATPRAFEWAIGVGSMEAVYGVQQADGSMTDWFQVTESDFAAIETTYDTDEDEMTGDVGATRHDVLEKKGTVARKLKASVELLEWALAMAFGNVSMAGVGDPFTATIKQRNVCTLNPPSFTYVEGLVCVSGTTGTYWLYKGCVIDKLTIEVTGKGPVRLTMTFKTDGSETAKTAFSWPASKYAGTRLYGKHLQVLFGPAGTEDITATVRTLKFEVDLGTFEPPSLGGVFVQELQYGQMNPKTNTTFTMKADKSHAVYGYDQNNTAIKCIVKFVVSASRQVVITQSQGVCKAVAKPAGSEVNLDVTFNEESNSTDGPKSSLAITAKSAIATVLVASP